MIAGKIVLAVIIISAFTFWGVVKSSEQKGKRELYRDLLALITRFKREITLSNYTVERVLSMSKGGEIFDKIIDDYIENSKTENEFSIGENYRLSPEERSDISTFFTSLGKGDKKNQLEVSDSYEKVFGGYGEIENEKCKKYCPLYVKLGFLLGVGIVVILI